MQRPTGRNVTTETMRLCADIAIDAFTLVIYIILVYGVKYK
jgi:hypothetical protein